MALPLSTKRRIRRLINTYPMHSFATDVDGKIFARHSNHPQWPNCKRIDDFAEPLLPPLISRLLKQAEQTGCSEHDREHPGSATIEVTCTPIRDKKALCFIFTIRHDLAPCSDTTALQEKLSRSYQAASQLSFQVDRQLMLINHDSAFAQLCLTHNPNLHLLIGKPVADILPADIAEQITQQVTLAYEADLTINSKLAVQLDDQQNNYVLKIIPIKSQDGSITGALCTGQPKERVSIKSAGNEPNFTTSLLSCLPNLIYWKDLDQTILGCNDAMLSHFEQQQGKADLETIDKDILYRNIKPVELDQYHKNDREVITTGQSETYYEKATIDGADHTFLSHKAPVIVNDVIIGSCGVSTDISQEINQIQALKKKNESLQNDLTRLSNESRKAEEHLNWIIDNLPGNVFWKNKEDKIMGCNKHLIDWLGLSAKSQLLGKSLMDTQNLHGVDDDGILIARQNDLEVMRTKKELVFEENVIVGDKTTNYLSRKAPLILGDECVGTIGIALDITKQKELEQKLKTANRLAENALQAKSDFIANISHDLRTPLHTLYGTAEQLENEEHLPAQNQKIETMLKCSQLILRLVDNVLHFSQLKDGTMQLHEKPCDLKQLMDSIFLTFNPLAKKKKITLHCDTSQVSNWQIHIDANALSRILINLIQNAMKHTRKGEVNVAVSEKPISQLQSTYTFSVQDTGTGIPKKELAQIFSRFYQGEKNKGYGLGLGLSITQRFTEMMGGTITVDSESGVGSTFTCSLPIMLSEHPPEEVTPFTQPAEKPRILLVEDNELIQTMTVQTLKKLDWEYELASTGEEALLAWRKQNISVILLDLGLPDQSGLDVLATIRQSDPETPVITLTGDATKETQKQCAEKGATGFLAKPATQEELVQAINQVLQEG